MIRKLRDACVVAAIAAGQPLATAAAPPTAAMPPLKRVPLLDESLPDGGPVASRVKGASIRFAPGQPTGLHRHPVSVVGIVTLGSFVFQVEGQPARTLHVGDAFLEPANATIVRFDNASASRPAAISAFYLTDSDDRPLIEMLDKQRASSAER